MSSKIRFAPALAAVLAVTSGIGVATGAIPSADGTMHACQTKVDGFRYVRLLDSGETCKAGEKAFSWNQKGPKGDPGPQGPRGAPGPAGPKGSGIGAVLENVVPDTIAAGASDQVSAGCPAGKHVVSGGWFTVSEDADVVERGGFLSSDANHWTEVLPNNTSQSQEVFVEANCV